MMGLECQRSPERSLVAVYGLGVGALGQEAREAGQTLLATIRSFDVILRATGEPWKGYKQRHARVRFKNSDIQWSCRKESTFEGASGEAGNR